jgi:cell division protein FtsL
MADEIITNAVILQHIQGMKYDLQQQINSLDQKISGVSVEVSSLKHEMRQGFESARLQFEEARQHRQALQEDLDATIRMVGKHQVKLTRL